MTRLFTAVEVGDLLGVPATKVRAEARAGRFPHHHIGRYRRFSEAQIDDYLQMTAVRTAPVLQGRPAR
jgi:excisionase family DNA binding protein